MQEENNKLHNCDKCTKSFAQRSGLSRHKKLVHNQNDNQNVDNDSDNDDDLIPKNRELLEKIMMDTGFTADTGRQLSKFKIDTFQDPEDYEVYTTYELNPNYRSESESESEEKDLIKNPYKNLNTNSDITDGVSSLQFIKNLQAINNRHNTFKSSNSSNGSSNNNINGNKNKDYVLADPYAPPGSSSSMRKMREKPDVTKPMNKNQLKQMYGNNLNSEYEFKGNLFYEKDYDSEDDSFYDTKMMPTNERVYGNNNDRVCSINNNNNNIDNNNDNNNDNGRYTANNINNIDSDGDRIVALPPLSFMVEPKINQNLVKAKPVFYKNGSQTIKCIVPEDYITCLTECFNSSVKAVVYIKNCGTATDQCESEFRLVKKIYFEGKKKSDIPFRVLDLTRCRLEFLDGDMMWRADSKGQLSSKIICDNLMNAFLKLNNDMIAKILGPVDCDTREALLDEYQINKTQEHAHLLSTTKTRLKLIKRVAEFIHNLPEDQIIT